jgi:hypothetical protein
MKRFKNFISEETMPYAGTSSGTIDIRDSGARDNINRILSGITHGRFVTPYIAFERVSKALANFLIFPPRQGFLEGDSGEVHFEIKQFGEKMGMNDDGTVVTAPELPYYIYFEYRLDDNGMFNIFCEVVDEDDLEEIFDDLEDEMNDEDDSEDSLDESHEKPVYEGNSENKEKKNQAIVNLVRDKINANGKKPKLRDARKKFRDDDNVSNFDFRNLRRVSETEEITNNRKSKIKGVRRGKDSEENNFNYRDLNRSGHAGLFETTLAGPETGSRKVPGSNQPDMDGDDTSMPDSIKRKVKLKLAESSWPELTKYQQGARLSRDMTSSLRTKLKRQKGIDLAQRKKWDRNVKVPATLPDEEDETDNNRR